MGEEVELKKLNRPRDAAQQRHAASHRRITNKKKHTQHIQEHLCYRHQTFVPGFV